MKTFLSITLRTLVLLLFFVSQVATQPAWPQSTTSPVQTPDAKAEDEPTPTQDSNLPSESDAASKVRIVRLSEVTGEVDVYRQTGNGYEPALLNLPITEGTELRTGMGFAEVEFEDNSLLHLTPNTIVEFPRLEPSPSGAKITTVNVDTGAVYVSLANTPGNEFTLTFAYQAAQLSPSSHVRLLVNSHWASLSVLHGDVRVETPTAETANVRNKTVNFQLLTPTEITLNKIAHGPYDEWDKNAVEYHKRFAKAGSYAALANAYGTSDLDYYGTFVDDSNCGVFWRPYFATAAWDPFANGSWVWYPDWGYTWVSPYPWGWTPYHYGTWEYCPTYGWGWRPLVGQWRTVANVPHTSPGTVKPRYGAHYPHPPHPPHAPHRGDPTIVTVNRQPPVRSGVNPGNKFVARQDSAGLGIPRVTLGNLNHLSGQLEKRGTDSVAVKNAPVFADNVRGSHETYVPSYGRGAEFNAAHLGSSFAAASGAGPSRTNSNGEAGSSRPSSSGGGGGRSSTSYASSNSSTSHSSGDSGSRSSGGGGAGSSPRK